MSDARSALEPRHGRFAFAALAALLLLASCAFPTRNPSVLKAIKADSEKLMRTWSTTSGGTVPKGEWPPSIAKLEPEFVTVYPDGVDIMTKPYFDGGWGYFVPRSDREPPEPAGRYSELGQGIYWYHPY